jgi:hypothetical protein
MRNLKTRTGVLCYVFGGLLLVTTVVAAAAQPIPEASPPTGDDDCQLDSLDTARPADPDGAPVEGSLTDALDPCNGVLEPPIVGDGELTIPPPAGGETPVIPPSQLPEQQP